MTSQKQSHFAKAYPTKEFFVRTITRDVSLEDSILDLIDNSIDSAWHLEGNPIVTLETEHDLTAYHISISIDADEFSIIDNCGGMTIDAARDYAFNFGRPMAKHQEDYSIGVYGIGMKRAVFKLGESIRVTSCYRNDEDSASTFQVFIDVPSWTQDSTPPWQFPINPIEDLPYFGVKIIVADLTSEVKQEFGNPAFEKNLRRIIARDYALHLQRGLTIELNGTAISGFPIQLRESEDFRPVRFAHQDRVKENVLVEVIGGMAARPPDDVDPIESGDGDRRFGWYIACNGRIVLAADKTSVSGWGTSGWPIWHPQYSGFIGIVLFTAANAADLPLTTTKRSVEATSDVFKRAQIEMKTLSKSWIAYTNARKQAADEAKRMESATTSVPIYKLQSTRVVKLPTFARRRSPKPANVNYSVPLDRMTRLAQEFGNINMPYRTVGLKSFDYAYEDLVEDDGD